jgi:hypothetical protein
MALIWETKKIEGKKWRDNTSHQRYNVVSIPREGKGPRFGGGRMAQVKALFYLPLKDTDGRDLTAEIEDLRTELYIRFRGWTFVGYEKGAYRMPDGTQAVDESTAYMVVVDESQVPEIEQLLKDFKSKTLQDAIYLEIQRDVDVRFI